jgi:hypothetical protein
VLHAAELGLLGPPPAALGIERVVATATTERAMFWDRRTSLGSIDALQVRPRGVLQGTRWAITFMGLAHVPGLCEKFSVGAALGDARICGPALRRLRAGGG